MRSTILFLILVACGVLSGCAAPMKFAYDWEEFERVRHEDSTVIDANFDSAWRAAKQAAVELQLTPVVENMGSGILTFIKAEEPYSNASFQLTVRLLREHDGNTRVWLRAVVYTNNTGLAGSVFPTDGSLENEFIEAMQQNF